MIPITIDNIGLRQSQYYHLFALENDIDFYDYINKKLREYYKEMDMDIVDDYKSEEFLKWWVKKIGVKIK